MINEKAPTTESYKESSLVNVRKNVGEMHKRRETMADGRRYMIYYTFDEEVQSSQTKPIKSEIV